MKIFLLIFIWLILFTSLMTYSVRELYSESSIKPGIFQVSRDIRAEELFKVNANITLPANISPSQDIRITTLQKFLYQLRSPLLENAEDIVKYADLYGLDYALVPAIAMQESNLCKVIPVDSYNCWGFGIYGNKITRFNSYKEAIAQVSKTIKETYIKKGLTNPTLLEDVWAPPSKGSWSYSVTYYITQIHNIERNTPAS